MSRRTLLASAAVYLAAAALVFCFVALRVKARYAYESQVAPDSLPYEGRTLAPPDPHAKPFFSVHTGRTYATTDRVRLWINYRGVESLDFRVYKVKDPVKFFRQLDNPHQVGEDEEGEVGKDIKKNPPTFLERLREFKSWGFRVVKTYVRQQLQNQSRKGFNQKFRPEEDDTSGQTRLDVSKDFARVPFLNPDQMVSYFREKLPPLEDIYDRRMISLGRREPGVYLVEAVNGDLKAYGIAVVTDLATVQKTSADGSMLVYAVERNSGAPRPNVNVLVVKNKNDVTKGTTDKQGLLKLKVVDKSKPPASEEEEGDDSEEEPAEEAAVEN